MREVTPAKNLEQLAKVWDVEADFHAEVARCGKKTCPQYEAPQKSQRVGSDTPDTFYYPSWQLQEIHRVELCGRGVRATVRTS